MRATLVRMLYPLAVLLFGALLVVTKSGSWGALSPAVEGPLVVVIGFLLCLSGVWGLIATLREIRTERNRGRLSSPSKRTSD